MLKLLKTKSLKNEEGSGLILAIMTLLVLSVLGASLGTITISEHRMSGTNRDSSSAYYIAEAGANMAYEEMEEIVTEAYEPSTNPNAFFQAINAQVNNDFREYSNFESQFGEQPKATVTVNRETTGESRTYTIESRANIGNHNRTAEKEVTVNWVEKDNGGGGNLPPLPTNATLIGKSQLNIAGNKVVGDIYINSSLNESVKLGNTDVSQAVFIHKPGINPQLLIEYLDWNEPVTKIMQDYLQWEKFNKVVEKFPSIPIYSTLSDQSNIKLDGDGGPFTVNLDDNTAFDTIELYNERRLRFNTKNSEKFITVNHLNLNTGDIEIVGNGSLTIFVKDSMTFGSSSSINRNGDSSDLRIFYAGSPDVSFSGDQRIRGSIFIKQAKLSIQGSSGIQGVILSGGSNVFFDGGTHASPLVFSPKAHVELDLGAKINGAIVGEKISLTGGAEVHHQSFDFDDFPFETGGSGLGTNPLKDNIITAEPVIESR